MTKTKKYLTIFLLTCSALCYNLPYLSSTFYTQFMESFQISNTQVGVLMTMFSLTATPGYLFGGLLADKFSPKKLILISQFLTAALGVCVSFANSFPVIMACYLGFGVSTTFIHWSAFLKLIRAQADEDNQGKTFGFFEFCYAIVSAITSYGILAALGKISNFRIMTSVYAAILVVIAVLIMIFLKDVDNVNSNEFNLKMAGKALVHPVTWLNGLIVMGLFIMISGTSYLNPYLSGVFGTTVAFATSFAIMNRCIVRLFVVNLGGSLLDKWKTPKFLIICSVSSIVFIAALMLMPQNSSVQIIGIVLAFLILISMSLSRAGLYTPIPEARVPMEITGTAMGICSAVGYSTDLWSYTLCGNWLDKFGNGGYVRIMGLWIAGLVLVIVCSILLRRYEVKHNVFAPVSEPAAQ